MMLFSRNGKLAPRIFRDDHMEWRFWPQSDPGWTSPIEIGTASRQILTVQKVALASFGEQWILTDNDPLHGLVPRRIALSRKEPTPFPPTFNHSSGSGATKRTRVRKAPGLVLTASAAKSNAPSYVKVTFSRYGAMRPSSSAEARHSCRLLRGMGLRRCRRATMSKTQYVRQQAQKQNNLKAT